MMRLNKTAWDRGWRRVKEALKPRRKRQRTLKVNTDDIRPELEAVVTALIRETEKDMDREFKRWIKDYDQKLPTGEKSAEAILSGLLKLAAANREQLNGRIVSSAEVGRMYDRYYDRLAEIDDLNAKAESSEYLRNRAKKEAEFFEKQYEEVRNRTYEVMSDEKDKKWWKKRKKGGGEQ